MRELHVTVIPAEPGHKVLIADDDKQTLEVGASVIAWRIDTSFKNTPPSTTCIPITLEGDAADYAIGILCPDDSVVLPGEESFWTYEAAKNYLYPVEK